MRIVAIRFLATLTMLALLFTANALVSIPAHAQTTQGAQSEVTAQVRMPMSLFRAYTSATWLSTDQNCSYLWQEHCRWLETNMSVCSNNYIIFNVSNGTWLGPNMPYPFSTSTWTCTGETRFGIHTGYAALYPLWWLDSYVLYYW